MVMEFCEVIENTSIIQNIREPILNDPISCSNPDGSILFLPASFNYINYPATYEWSNGDSTLNIYQLENEIFSLTITDNRGCEWNGEYELGSNIIDVSDVITPTCEGLSNGSISLAVQSSLENETFSFSWSNGGNESSIDSLDEGIYYVTITGETSNCEKIDSFEVPLIPSDSFIAQFFQMT
jgi:hypothetical protein